MVPFDTPLTDWALTGYFSDVLSKAAVLHPAVPLKLVKQMLEEGENRGGSKAGGQGSG